jgi:hypothetical protein
LMKALNSSWEMRPLWQSIFMANIRVNNTLCRSYKLRSVNAHTSYVR